MAAGFVSACEGMGGGGDAAALHAAAVAGRVHLGKRFDADQLLDEVDVLLARLQLLQLVAVISDGCLDIGGSRRRRRR